MNRNLQRERNTASWAWAAIRPYHGMVILQCCLALLRTAAALVNVVLLRNLIDAASVGDRDGLARTAILLIVTSLSQVGLTLSERYIHEATSHRIHSWIQGKLYRALLNKDYVQVSSKHTGEWMNRLNADIGSISGAATKILPGLIAAAVHCVGACVLLVRISPFFLVLTVVGGVGLVLLNLFFKEPLKQRQRELRDAIGVKNVYQMEHISHLLIIKAFHRETVVADNADDKIETVLQKKLAKLRLTLAKSGLQDGIATVGQIAVLLYCAIRILRGTISYGTCVMLLRLTSQIVTPFTTISGHVTDFFDVMVSVERLRELESYGDDPAGYVLSDPLIRRFYDDAFRDIRFTDMTFAYHDREAEAAGSTPTVFSHVDLTIPKQCCMAFTGSTGSGKSTFFKLLMSFYTLQAGTITVRSLDGQEQPLDSSFRRLFAYVPQGNQLMAGTVRDMVTFGSHDPAERDENIWAVLETACAKEFVEQLPQGLDTVIREKGVGLSEGQLQRIAIARALYSRRPILLLDEATSALDEATERELLTHLKQMTDLTILFATHRASGLGICDREVHIDGDRVLLRTLRQDP